MRKIVLLFCLLCAESSAQRVKSTVFDTYDAFGDSITWGYASSTAAGNYVSLLGGVLGVVPTNHGISGAQAADLFDYVYALTPSPSRAHLSSLMVGTNDNAFGQQTVGYHSMFDQFEQALAAWLAIPNKLLAQGPSITYTGLWSDSSYYGGGVSRVSTTNGSTASATVHGSVVYVACTIEDRNGGKFSITVDGVTVTYQATAPVGATISTHLGRGYGSALFRIAGLSSAQHVVVVTVSSETGTANKVQLDWLADGLGDEREIGPAVYLGGVPRQVGSGYCDDKYTQEYSARIKSSVALLAGDGLHVMYADTPHYLLPGTDLISDGIHPNDRGMAHLKDSFVAAMDILSDPQLW